MAMKQRMPGGPRQTITSLSVLDRNGFVQADGRRVWATPTQSDGMGGPGNSGRDGGENLRTQVGGSLNPTWVEWLQGFLLGWTEVD